MRATLRRPVSLLALVLAFLVCLAALPSTASAQAPSLTIFGPGTGRCPEDGRPIASGPQGSIFQVAMANFPLAPAIVTVTLPNGRIFALAELGAAFAPVPFPAPVPAPVPGLTAVDAAREITTGPGWPTGCYTVTVTDAATFGATPPPTIRATARFLVTSAPQPAQPSNLQLMVHAAGTTQPTAVQPLLLPPAAPPIAVNIFGRGPIGAPPPVLAVIGPDGAQILPAPVALPTGSPGGFAVPYVLPAGSPPGTYTFVATTLAGVPPAPVASVRAQFTVTAPPSAARGNAVLVMDPFSTLVTHPGLTGAAPIVTVQGRNVFIQPGTLVTPVLVLPDGSRLAAAPLPPNPNGNMVTIPPVVISRLFPTGAYRLELVGVASTAPVGSPATVLASIGWRVNP